MAQVVSDPAQLAQLLQAGDKVGQYDCQLAVPDAAPAATPAAPTTVIPNPPDVLRTTGADGVSGVVAAAPAQPARRGAAGSHLPRELAVLFWRTAADTARNPSLLLLHWALALATGVLLGAIFWQVDSDMSGIQNRGGALGQGAGCSLGACGGCSLRADQVPGNARVSPVLAQGTD